MLDPENWKIALEVYAKHPRTALQLAEQLDAIVETLHQGNKGIPNAIAALNLAIESLYPHTSFDKASRKLFRQRIAGTLKLKQEEKLRELGVRF